MTAATATPRPPFATAAAQAPQPLPLPGRRVAFTTPPSYAGRLTRLLDLRGATPLPVPTVVVEPTPATLAALGLYLPFTGNAAAAPSRDTLDSFSALAFTSRTGISAFALALSGAGRAFCSGVDLTAAEAVFKGDVKDAETDPVCQMGRCRKPIVGAITGFAVTGGLEIALACDVLVAGRGAKFIDTHARFGIFPSWGLSQKLSRIIGPNRAREFSLTATPITAEMAEKWGLVNHVVDSDKVLSKATEVAEAMLRNNRDLVLRYKAVINDGLKLDLDHALALEKERAHEYYDGMTKEQFQMMQKFISSRKSQPSSKL